MPHPSSNVGQALVPTRSPAPAPVALPQLSLPPEIPSAPADAGIIGKLLFNIQNDPDLRRAIQTSGLTMLANQGGNLGQNLGRGGLAGLNTFENLRGRREQSRNDIISQLNEQARTRAVTQQAATQAEGLNVERERIAAASDRSAAELKQRKVEAENLKTFQAAQAKSSSAAAAAQSRLADARKEELDFDKLKFESEPERVLIKAIDEVIATDMPDATSAERTLLRVSMLQRRDAIAKGNLTQTEIAKVWMEALIEQNTFKEDKDKLTIEQIANTVDGATRSFAIAVGIPGGPADFTTVLKDTLNVRKLKDIEVSRGKRTITVDGKPVGIPTEVDESADVIADEIKSKTITRADIETAAATGRAGRLGLAGTEEDSALRVLAESKGIVKSSDKAEFIRRMKEQRVAADAPPVQRFATAPLVPNGPPVSFAKGAQVTGAPNKFFAVGVDRQPIIDPRTGQPITLTKEQFAQHGIIF